MPKHWKTLIATAALLGTTSSIALAGGYETAGRGYAPAPQANWGGFYIGRHVGVGFQDKGDRNATVIGGSGGGGGGGGGNAPDAIGGDGGNNGGGGGGGGGNDDNAAGGAGGNNAGGGGGGGGNNPNTVGGDGGNNSGGGGGGGGNDNDAAGGAGGNNAGGGGGGGGNNQNTVGGDGGDNAGDGGDGGDNANSGGSAGGGDGGGGSNDGAGGGGSGGGDGGFANGQGGGGGGGSGGGDGGPANGQGGGGGGGSGGGIGGFANGNGGGGGGGSGGGIGALANGNGGGGGGGGGTGATIAARMTSDDTSLLAGTHIGYNWQLGQTVLGVEGDYSANDNLDDYLASIRGRLGWATGNYLLYGTAGVAFAGRGGDDNAIGVAAGGGDGGVGGAGLPDGGNGGNGGAGSITKFGDRDSDDTGWVAGGGVEAMLSPMAIVGLEALYYMIDSDNRIGNTGDDDFLAIRARLSAHLGGGAFSTAPTAHWAGLYMGGNIGALFNQNDKIASVQLSNNGSAGGNGGVAALNGGGGAGGGGGGAAAIASLEDDSSVVGGVHLGINWQNGHWVFGAEGDISAVEDTYEYVASLRGRLGWAYEQVLLYATAGLALAKDDSFDGTLFVGNGGDGANGADGTDGVAAGGAGGPGGVALVTNNGGSNDVETGLVIGAGTDVKLSEQLSLGMEGMYYFFDDGGNGAIIDPSTGESIGSLDDDNEFAIVRARLTYHFGEQPMAPLK